MNKTIRPSALQGSVRIIPSKSASHRAVMLAAMAQGACTVGPLQLSRDIEATLACAKALGLTGGAQLSPLPGGLVSASLIGGAGAACGPRTLYCGESGSTLRFFIPLALDGRGPVTFIGHGRLMQRPLGVYEELFLPRGVSWQKDGDRLTVEGCLTPGEYALPGDVSSQFITGLLLALPGLDGESVIRITTKLESRAYVELTRRIQQAFGVVSRWADDHTLVIPGSQTPVSPGRFEVEGDWSHAAFYLVAGAIGRGGPVTLTGLDLQSTQGDRAILGILRGMGARITLQEDGSIAARPSSLTGAEVDVSQTPDLVPALAVAMAAAKGESRITGAGRLRIKESDRLAAMRAALCAAGADVTELPDGLIIRGGNPLHAAAIDGCNDHRIVMAMAVASAIAEGDMVISDAEAVAKSALAFYDEFASLGGIAL
ncbi:MAG: 3-phosphoshikimate 1-carboxyvinyltransferase [Clostridia bacterium]|nr:3-phosphoshikimate 1-carboxyvinyltransferase [Clostridia bacterium]